MVTDLIIDGNYILSRLVFVLYKNNVLYGSLESSLENTISSYRKWYPFSNIYLVSDSKEKSWRKTYNSEYKLNRKRDTQIDWNFVYECYYKFKLNVSGGRVKVLESPNIEGDDWISFLVKKSNDRGRSTIIVSNDHDIKQLIKFNLSPLYINIMTNEMMGREKVFLPNNYEIFLDSFSKLPNDDIFNLNDNNDFLTLMDKFLNKYDIKRIDSKESLIIKIISGDSSDNIKSVWSKIKNGKKRGIGEKGAKTIYDNYIKEFGEPIIEDINFCENVADLLCEKKKLNKSSMSDIVENIKNNIKLVDLRLENIPDDIVKTMEEKYNILKK
jgi:5'-3' exonuclease